MGDRALFPVLSLEPVAQVPTEGRGPGLAHQHGPCTVSLETLSEHLGLRGFAAPFAALERDKQRQAIPLSVPGRILLGRGT